MIERRECIGVVHPALLLKVRKRVFAIFFEKRCDHPSHCTALTETDNAIEGSSVFQDGYYRFQASLQIPIYSIDVVGLPPAIRPMLVSQFGRIIRRCVFETTRGIDEIYVPGTQGSLDEPLERLGFVPEDLPRLPGSCKSEYGAVSSSTVEAYRAS